MLAPFCLLKLPNLLVLLWDPAQLQPVLPEGRRRQIEPKSLPNPRPPLHIIQGSAHAFHILCTARPFEAAPSYPAQWVWEPRAPPCDSAVQVTKDCDQEARGHLR